MEMEGGVVVEDFGQKVDLTRKIREVLCNYPEGTTILKELVQNADDAGATKLCFCLDRRTHGSHSLLFPNTSQFQGPALLSYNNAPFSDQDFLSISRIGGSTKQGQPWKTGRFGVGFNSVYHLSDLPSFVSGRYVVFFDPHCKYLPRISAADPGKRVEFVSSSAFTYYKDQFEPYSAFGCDMLSPYFGSLFRFPLRTADQAATSLLSKQFYSEGDIISLLQEFYSETVMTMLFLKNIEVIEMYDWQDGLNSPCMLYLCRLNTFDEKIRLHRQNFARLSRAWPLNETGVLLSKQLDAFILSFTSINLTGSCKAEKESSFLIVQCMEASTSRIGLIATNASKAYDIQLMPWAAVAADISHWIHQEETKASDKGHAFCFLPLPVETGLPVHVNGYFELSSNRRDIWYGTDMDRMGKLRSDWNNILLSDVVAPTYCHLLSVVYEHTGFKQLHYELWPSGSFRYPWHNMVSQFYRKVIEYSVLYSDVGEGEYITPLQAVLYDEGFFDAGELAFALALVELPIVLMPKPLVEMFHVYNPVLKYVCPKMVRSHLLNHPIINDRACALVLLEYCLSDIIDKEATEALLGLPLVPLSDGRFGVFGKRSDGRLYFICDNLEYRLLNELKDMVIDSRIPERLFSRLSQIARLSHTNVCLFSSTELAKLLVKILPGEWQFRDEVEWNPESAINHPKKEWINILWKYFDITCADLSVFKNWPIIPTTSGVICKAEKSLGIIGMGVLPEEIDHILRDVGCKFLNFGCGVAHPRLSEYVHAPTGSGIIDAISSISLRSGSCYEVMLMNLNNLQRRKLRTFLLDPKWYTGNQMTQTHLREIRSLPIFEVYSGPGKEEMSFVDIRGTDRFIPPSNVDASLFGPEFLYTQSGSQEQILCDILKVQRMARSLFYKCKVIDCIEVISPNIRNPTLLKILRELPELSLQDLSIKDALAHSSFIPTANGKLRRPKELYDPRVGELYTILSNQDSFPSDDFRDHNILDILAFLGLRTTVSPETILESAGQVEFLISCEPDKALLRGRALLTYLELNSNNLSSQYFGDNSRSFERMFTKVVSVFQNQWSGTEPIDNFWHRLSNICWCPVLVLSPHPSLPWPSVNSPIAPPRLIRLPSDLWLASASMRILDGECNSALLSQKLGWLDPLAGNVVAAQLLELGRNHAMIDDVDLKRILAAIVPRIYTLLTSWLGTDEIEIMKTMLEGSRWVWVGDEFVNVEEVVLNGIFHLAPYMRVIPTDLACFKDLFIALGVRESLTFMDFVHILDKMARIKNGKTMKHEELKAAIWIVQHLADPQFEEKERKLFVPDITGTLLQSSELVYNDAPWLMTSGGMIKRQTGSKGTLKFVHPNISNDVAQRLGIRSLRRLLLAENADSFNLSLHENAEAFGQHEALTTRLKHIVEMYADGPGILFELVQNADDAGASEISFLMDKSEYGSSSILSPQMSDWQGPALYCFNNSVFTERDLYAISRIGQDSKMEKPFTVGRFGLGFNSVYHFTDVPGFVSGDNLIIFDPHASNLPGISPSHPGLKIHFAGTNILEQFPDQCHPYLLFGCDMQKHFNGTLFRFALRNCGTAVSSQIKNEVYTSKMVIDLFSSFQKIAAEGLLFLRNISVISVYVRERLTEEMQLLFRVQRQNLDINPQIETERAGKFFHDDLFSIPSKEYLYKTLQKMPEEELPWHCGKLRITMSGNGLEEARIWFVSNIVGGGRARAMAVKKENRARGFLPWAGVAALLHIEVEHNGIETSNKSKPDSHVEGFSVCEGHAFCFLPLPVQINLPVHVNGYFELSSNRRDIWYGVDMSGGGKLRSDWNRFLLEDVASSAYVRLLARIRDELEQFDVYYSLWPTMSVSEPWNHLLCGVYIAAVKLELPVLYTTAGGGRWLSAKQAVFPDFSFPLALELNQTLINIGLALVNSPKGVVERFHEFCPSLRYLTPGLLRYYLSKRRKVFRDRDGAIMALRYCLFDVEATEAAETLQGLPLIPLATGSYGVFTCWSREEEIYVTNDAVYNLLKDILPEKLVDCSIDSELFGKIQNIADCANTNLAMLTDQHFKDFLSRLLPHDWHGKRIVFWTPGQAGHPTEAWLESLWNALRLNYGELSLFSEWPLLPTSDGHLVQLRKDSYVIKDGGWNESLISFLKRAQCFVLKTNMPINHPQLQEYVQDANASGFLNALCAAVEGQLCHLQELFKSSPETELQEARNFLLQMKWYSTGQMHASQIEVLKALPIYRSYGVCQFVSLSESKHWLAPKSACQEFLDEHFLHVESPKEENILLNILGVQRLGKQDFYEQHLFKKIVKMPVDVIGRIMPPILNNLSSLTTEFPSILSSLSHSSFVPNSKGNIEKPGRLYDPRKTELLLLLDEEFFFPAKEFREDGTLDALLQLGLRKSMGCGGVLDSARSVEMLSNVDEQEALKKGQVLLAYLDGLDSEARPLDSSNLEEHKCSFLSSTENYVEASDVFGSSLSENSNTWINWCNEVSQESEKDFWNQLSAISWCPVYLDPPEKNLPWPSGLQGVVVPPKGVRTKSQIWHVSATMRILKAECHSTYLMRNLGWLEKPNAIFLSVQLIELSKCFALWKSGSTLPSILNSSSETDEKFDVILSREILCIYKLMEGYLDTEDVLVLKSMLDGMPWIWTGDSFVSAQQVAFEAPAHFEPYLHAVPSELCCFKDLLIFLGVRMTFNLMDYISVLHRIADDVKGSSLDLELLNFVFRVLEAIYELLLSEGLCDNVCLEAVLIPDASGVLAPAKDLVYNDAPWLLKASPGVPELQRFVHPGVQNMLAERLGAKSWRYLSFVDKEMTRDLPCLHLSDINKLLIDFGDKTYLSFDLLELADCCKARKMHLIYDKREHSQISLLQPNFGQFQGPALTVAFEGMELSMEEVCRLQNSPLIKIRSCNSNYGAGLLSCYYISDFSLIISGGCLYVFDPSGLILATSLTDGKAPLSGFPAGKAFTLQGTDLPDRFADQFKPFHFSESLSWFSTNVTIVRMPMRFQQQSSDMCSNHNHFDEMVDSIFEKFKRHASSALLFLNSVEEVCLLRWENDQEHPDDICSVRVDPLCAPLRNPFDERKWKKFQLSSIFGSSNPLIKTQVVEVYISENGSNIVDKWIIVLSLGSGQTRNLALDRKYLAYNPSPVAGIAAHVSRNGSPPFHAECTVLSPLPLTVSSWIPVTILGHFLVSHTGMRHVFHSSPTMGVSAAASDIIQPANLPIKMSWNKELMTSVRDSYVDFLLQCQRLAHDSLSWHSKPNHTQHHKGDPIMSVEYMYSLWPRSQSILSMVSQVSHSQEGHVVHHTAVHNMYLVDLLVKPMYLRLADLSVWQLQNGRMVKATEGVFLSPPKCQEAGVFPSVSVCQFLKEHFKVFSVPWELITELQAAGIVLKVATPKMVRTLIKSFLMTSTLYSVKMHIDLLVYCCSDFQLQNASIDNNGILDDNKIDRHFPALYSQHNEEGDSFEIVANFGRVLLDFGKGVIEDLKRDVGQRVTVQSPKFDHASLHKAWIADLKGLPCPTMTGRVARLGMTELWVGSKEQQILLLPLAERFLHSKCLEQPLLLRVFEDQDVQSLLRVKCFSSKLLSENLQFVLPKQWLESLKSGRAAPWMSWEQGPSSDWLRIFWNNVNSCSMEELSLFDDWPLIPCLLGCSVLVKVKHRNMIFVPPNHKKTARVLDPLTDFNSDNFIISSMSEHLDKVCSIDSIKFGDIHASLVSFLYKCNIPIYDDHFMDFSVVKCCANAESHTLGHLIVSKLLASKKAGCFSLSNLSLSSAECEFIFFSLANNFSKSEPVIPYSVEELSLLQSLPIYKTRMGCYTAISTDIHCLVPLTSFIQPQSDFCLQYHPTDECRVFYHALGVPELTEEEVMVRFGLPAFECKSEGERESILTYLYADWDNLKNNNAFLDALRETQFITSKPNMTEKKFFKPRELLDPTDALLCSIYTGDDSKFPNEKFRSEKWLEILRKAGLRSSLDADVLLECARKVEDLGKSNGFTFIDTDLSQSKHLDTGGFTSFDVWSLAGSVVETIVTNMASLYSTNFCESLSKIECVPAEKGIPTVIGEGKKVLSSYSDTVLTKDWPLAWMCSPILKIEKFIPPRFFWSSLHLQSPPPFQTILHHLQLVGRDGGEDVLARWPTAPGMKSVEDAFSDVLRYLSNVWDNLTESDKRALCDVPFIPVANGTRLTCADALYLQLKMNLAPFVFALPSTYFSYVKVLKGLGMREAPSSNSMKSLLLHMHKTCGYHRLNPNELAAILRILQFIHDETKKEANQLDAFNKSVEDAIVPDNTGRLIHAHRCVYIDALGSSLIDNIDVSKVRFAHPQMSEELCIQLGIHKLSDVVQEVLQEDIPLEVVDSFGSTSLSTIVEKLRSRCFQEAVYSVIQSFGQKIPSLASWKMEDVENQLQGASYKLKFVHRLYTQFLLLPGNIDITHRRAADMSVIPNIMSDEYAHRVFEYMDKSKNILLVSEPPNFISLSDILAVTVSRLFDSPVCLPLSILFSLPAKSEDNALKIMRLRNQLCDLGDNGLTMECRSIFPGEKISISDAAQIQIHPLRPFYSGEIVAWHSDADEESSLRYGFVLDDVRAPPSQPLYRLRVEIASGEVRSLLSSSVFSFKGMSTRRGSAAQRETGFARSPQSDNGSFTTPRKSSLVEDHKEETIPIKKVQAAEVVQAVSDMMSSVGLPVDLERQSLLHECLTLQEELTASRFAVALEQEKADTALKEADIARSAWFCRICLSSEVDTTLVPCGHVLCQRCASAVTKCPFCRESVSKALHMYRP